MYDGYFDWSSTLNAMAVVPPLFIAVYTFTRRIVSFDESFKNDPDYGGGHIATVVVGPGVKQHFTDSAFYQHQSLLAILEDALGLPRLEPVQDVPALADVFK